MEMTELSMKSFELQPPPFGNVALSPYEVDYGTEAQAQDISYRGISVRLGDRPIAKNLRRLYELAHNELPPDLAVYDAYEIWLICHAIGAADRQGNAQIAGLGYEADFANEKEVLTIDLLPQTRFNTLVEGSWTSSVDLGAEGNMQVAQTTRQLLEEFASIGADARLQLSSELKCVGRLSFSILSPQIQAVGKGGSRCEWLYERDDRPLLGDQIMLQTILVPPGTPEVRFKARGYALLRPNWVPFGAPFYTEWIDVTCSLK